MVWNNCQTTIANRTKQGLKNGVCLFFLEWQPYTYIYILYIHIYIYIYVYSIHIKILNTTDKKGGLSLATNEWWDGDRTSLSGWCFHGFKRIQAFNLKNLGWSTSNVYLPNGFSATQQERATIIRDMRIIDVLKFNWWMNNMKRGGAVWSSPDSCFSQARGTLW